MRIYHALKELIYLSDVIKLAGFTGIATTIRGMSDGLRFYLPSILAMIKMRKAPPNPPPSRR
jgi:hypothetical protein